MYGHPLAGLASRAAIARRLAAGAVGFCIGMAAAAIFYQLGVWA